MSFITSTKGPKIDQKSLWSIGLYGQSGIDQIITSTVSRNKKERKKVSQVFAPSILANLPQSCSKKLLVLSLSLSILLSASALTLVQINRVCYERKLPIGDLRAQFVSAKQEWHCVLIAAKSHQHFLLFCRPKMQHVQYVYCCYCSSIR